MVRGVEHQRGALLVDRGRCASGAVRIRTEAKRASCIAQGATSKRLENQQVNYRELARRARTLAKEHKAAGCYVPDKCDELRELAEIARAADMLAHHFSVPRIVKALEECVR